MESPTQPFLEVERKSTDDSLGAERDKTNNSLASARTSAEQTTDRAVDAERLLTDQKTTSSRTQTDDGSENMHLRKERKRADRATEQERTRIDLAILQEREVKRALTERFLVQEREQTDENLLAERRRTDSEIRQSSTLLSAEIIEHLKTKTSLTTRDEFLAIVSHDLKNPLGTASVCAAMLLEDSAYVGLAPEVRTWIELIKRNVDTSLRLIGDLLDMERVAEGKLQLNFEHVDIGELIGECLTSFSVLATTKQVRLLLLPPDISGDIYCDRDRIEQVLSNLIGNAIKFTPQGGLITINTDFRKTDLLVSVHDTGPGIPESKKEQIFERFVQLSPSDHRGLGLGLHVSTMLIEAHRGRLWVESKLGAGSTFSFTLPRHLD